MESFSHSSQINDRLHSIYLAVDNDVEETIRLTPMTEPAGAVWVVACLTLP